MKINAKAADLPNHGLKLGAVTSQQNKSQQNLSRYLFVNVGLILIFEAILLGALFLVTPNNFSQAFSAPLDSQTIRINTILSLVNQERANYDIKELTINIKLQAAAEQKARDLMNQQYFSHTSPKGKTFSAWIKSAGYEYYRAGENLAIFFKDDDKVVKAWMDSDKHRQNILNPYYTETGIAVVTGNFKGKSTQIVVQLFGQPTELEKESSPLLLTLE